VNAQRSTQTLTNAGHFEDTHEVHFTSDNGNSGMVRVPAAKFTPGNVDQAIQDHLQNIEGVAQLGAEPHPDNLA
jgi:hypothetical protein